MKIECPGCEAAYEVPVSQIRPGRSVRCARCDVEWRPAGDPPPHSEPPTGGGIPLRQHAAPALPAAIERVAPAPRRRIAAWGLGWAASLVILAGLLGSAMHWRQAVMRDWPPSARLYMLFGAQPRGIPSSAQPRG